MKNVEPKVYLIGQTRKNDAEIRRWLDDLGAQEYSPPDTATDSEILISLAAKRCYMSFTPLLNPNVTRVRTDMTEFIDNILKSRHGSVLEHVVFNFAVENVSRVFTAEMNRHRAGMAMCLSGDTMIYSEHRAGGRRNGAKKRHLRDLYAMTQTPHGRSRIKLLRLRVLDEKTGGFTTGRVATITNSGVKPLFEIELTGGYRLKLTKDHRLLTTQGWLRLQELVNDRLFVTPLGEVRHGAPIAKVAVNGWVAPATAKRLDTGDIAYRTKEWVETQIRAGRTFAQISTEAGVSAAAFRVWTRKLGVAGLARALKLTARAGNKGLRYRLHPMTPEQYAHHMKVVRRGANHPMWRGGITPHPMPTPLRLEILTRDMFRCRMCQAAPQRRYLDVHHIDPYAPGKASNEDTQNLITLCDSCHGKVTGREADYAAELYALLRNPTRPRIESTPKPGAQLHARYVELIGMRYCGEEDTYDIEMEGPHHNFVANGVIVHNSEGSLRFIRFTDIPWWVPLAMRPEDEDDAQLKMRKDETVQVFTDAFRHQEHCYRRLEEIWDLTGVAANNKAFSVKKKLTSMFRRIIGMGVATGGVWSGNIRALRHIFTMRCDPAAEEEILLVASLMLIQMREAEPILFGDFTHTDGYWQPRYWKV